MGAPLPEERKPLLPKEKTDKTFPPGNGNQQPPAPGKEVYPKGDK